MESAATMTSDDEQYSNRQAVQRGWPHKTVAVAAALGLAFVGAYAFKNAIPQDSSLRGVQDKEERIEIVPSFPQCAKSGENCYDVGCCKVSGHKCYSKQKLGRAECNATCTPGVQGYTCDVVGTHSVPSTPLGNELYCFAVYTQNTGSPKPSTELDLLQMQKRNGWSIFACESWDVFTDGIGMLDDYGMMTVEDELGEFHVTRRTDGGEKTWVNWGLFYQVWVKVRELGNFRNGDYVVKADADAVFVPQRLRDYFSQKGGDSPHGIYFENCPKVQFGFFGNLEVMTKTAANVLTTYLEECHAAFAPCAFDGCDWKYGAWGEDVFVQRCLDHHYVDKVEGFDLTTDGACEADRPEGEKKNKKWKAPDCSVVTTPAAHPFKKPSEYMKCMSEMTGVKTYKL